jgi:hypothetical protein
MKPEVDSTRVGLLIFCLMAAQVHSLKKSLPPEMVRYLYFPLKISILGMFFVPAVFFYLSNNYGSVENIVQSSQATALTASVSEVSHGEHVSCTGSLQCALLISGESVSVQSGALAGSSAYKGADGRLVFGDQTGTIIASLASRNGDEGQVIELYDRNNSLRFQTKPDDEGYKILSYDRTFVSRIKLKEGKFNLYNELGARTLYGKEKSGAISLRSDDGTEVGKINYENGVRLEQAAALATSLPEEYRVLLFAHALGLLR